MLRARRLGSRPPHNWRSGLPDVWTGELPGALRWHLWRLREVAESLDLAVADNTLRSQLTILGGLRTTLNLAALMTLMDDSVSVYSAGEKNWQGTPTKGRKREPCSTEPGVGHGDGSSSGKYTVTEAIRKATPFLGRDQHEPKAETVLSPQDVSSPGHPRIGTNGAGRPDRGAAAEPPLYEPIKHSFVSTSAGL